MAISSKSLFHFTPKLEVLKSILTTGFRYSPCNEELPGQGFSEHVDRYLHVVRVVCFCDIPLSQSAAHRNQYGSHAIAMSKDWSINVGVTPIRYLHSRSPDMRAFFLRRLDEIRRGLTQCKGGIFEFYAKYLEEIGFENPPSFEREILGGSVGLQKLLGLIEDDYEEILEAYSRLISLSRVYEGDWKDRETNTTSRRCFYDEREWRAISLAEEPEELEFTFEDINYMIVNNLEEQKALATFILSGVSPMFKAPEDPGTVWSKILTSERILADI